MMKHCPALVILGALLLSSCSSAPIPQNKMMDIYYDMFTIDNVVMESPEAMALADSMSVYGAVFSRYGYTVEDYLSAVDYYLRKPETFARMMKKVQGRITREIAELEAKEQEAAAAAAAAAETVEEPEDPDDSDATPVSEPVSRRPKPRDSDTFL